MISNCARSTSETCKQGERPASTHSPDDLPGKTCLRYSLRGAIWRLFAFRAVLAGVPGIGARAPGSVQTIQEPGQVVPEELRYELDPLVLRAQPLRQAGLERPEVDPTLSEENGSTALHIAALNGDETITQMLIARGVDLEARTARGYTAAEVASEAHHSEVVQILREAETERRL